MEFKKKQAEEAKKIKELQAKASKGGPLGTALIIWIELFIFL